ncbi:hypothetical protein [Sorangium sp. So ce887]|uniref:hypothetical protein n=1 Tax=Sorangium sp. So ce887 TaxID=3133324 RepID=UPI003F63F224
MRRERLWILCSILLFLALGFFLFASGGTDDTHITYWVSHALARHGQLLNFNGERIEQSSSLGLVCLLALLHRITTIPIPILGHFTGLAFGAAAIAWAVWLARAVSPRLAYLAAPLVATTGGFLYWSTSGMESSFAAFAAVLALLQCARFQDSMGADAPASGAADKKTAGREPAETGDEAADEGSIDEGAAEKRASNEVKAGEAAAAEQRPGGERPVDRGLLIRAGLAMLLFVTVRPESPVVLLCVLVAAVAGHGIEALRLRTSDARRRLLGALLLLGCGAAAVALLLAFRQAYFGSFLPNPAVAKSGGFALSEGLKYLWRGIWANNVAMLLSLVLVLVLLGRDLVRGRVAPALLFTAAFCFAYLGFIATSGGDWMPGARFLSQAIPALAALTIMVIDRMIRRPMLAITAVALFAGLNLFGTLRYAREDLGFPGTSALEFAARVRSGIPEPGFTTAELLNRSHLRDAPLIATLLDLMRQLGPTSEDPVYLMSGQAGMIPYYVFLEHGSAARLIDLYSLTSDRLLRCLPRNHLKQSVYGSAMSYEYFFKNQRRIRKDCRLPKPTIIFSTSLRPPLRRLLAENGYTVVYHQKGQIRDPDRGSFFQASARAEGFIAVLKERAEKLNVKKVPLPW